MTSEAACLTADTASEEGEYSAVIMLVDVIPDCSLDGIRIALVETIEFGYEYLQ